MDNAPPKGMRDFAPEKMIEREQTIGIVKSIFRKYGFKPLGTPAVETLDVLNKKCGDEIAGQIFKIADSELGLRFDMTVPLARAVAASNFARPFKRYVIGPVWRREEPQKGRLREFVQADIDIVGCAGMKAEAELIACAVECIRALGFDKPRVKINNRKIMDAVFESLKIPKENEFAVYRALDKLEKIGKKEVEKELDAKGVEKPKIGAIFSLLEGKGENDAKVAVVETIAPEGAAEMRSLLSLLEKYGVDVEVDLALVRGLDYYTGPVFEIQLGGGIGSVAGGGRYDKLLSMYGQPDSAVGISLGIERLMALLEEKKKAGEEKKTYTEVYVAAVKEEFFDDALKIAQKLRSEGIACETDLLGRNLRKQFEYANSSGIPWAAIVGEKERNEKKVTLRNFVSGEEKLVTISDAVQLILAKK